MDTLFTKGTFNKCEICAYHESGHILFAYLCGYSCSYVELISDKNEDDFTSIAVINYGNDSFLASRFINSNASIDFFQTLNLAQKLEAIEVGRRIARIFLGGSVAAAVFNNAGNIHIPLPMQIDFSDLLKVEFIQQVVNKYADDKDDMFIENTLQDALYTLSNINIWNTINDLAQRLLKTNQLNKNDIEECLEEHGIVYNQQSTVDASFSPL